MVIISAGNLSTPQLERQLKVGIRSVFPCALAISSFACFRGQIVEVDIILAQKKLRYQHKNSMLYHLFHVLFGVHSLDFRPHF